MKRILIHSHILAAFLQLAPLVRVAQSAPGVVAAPTLFMGAIAPVLFGLAIEWLGPAGASLFLLVLGVLSTGLAGRLVRLARNQAASSIHAC